MFSGIVEGLGQVGGLQRRGDSARLQVVSPLAARLKVGDSVSVNGVCLTVVAKDERRFTVQIAPETMRRTNLGGLRSRERVNLELALKAGDRLGGHLVQGHVDGVGCIRRQQRNLGYAVWTISAPRELMKYVIPKGSIAVDGVSLTIVETKAGQFSVSLIPHTLKHTTLGQKKVGQKVNLEVDMMGKYVERMMGGK
jgi:riboflavin synthase